MIDVGGGSTGISVATFGATDATPAVGTIDVADGIRIGGDDVAKAVVERHLMPALVQALDHCKIAHPRDFLTEILGGRSKSRPAWLGGFARRFARDFAYPLAMALVKAHAEAGDLGGDVASKHTIGSLLTRSGVTSRIVVDELDDLAGEEGAIGFSCQAVQVSFLADELNATILGVLGQMLGNAVHLIEALGCDVVVLSGPISRIPAVIDVLIEAMPARAGRIVQLADYAFGDWCPFRTAAGTISDPKLLAAVGALIAADDAGNAMPIRMRPNVSEEPLLVGCMDADGLVRDDRVLFRLEQPGEERLKSERTTTLTTDMPCILGARRMPFETWPATPYFVVDLATPSKGRVKEPLRVTIERVIQIDPDREELILIKAIDAEGATLSPRDVALRFQTLAASRGYWLDTGAIALG